MMYAMGLVTAVVLIVSTVLAAMCINRIREWFEARTERDQHSRK